jgi:2-polyprenyl-6-methoxyphenol hydroxylase-like FAD-dependent oxidoreductase
MVGVLPVGSASDGHPAMATFFWSIRDDEDPLADRERWVAEVRTVWPECVQLVRNAEPVRARYRHHTHARPVEPGLVRIGDAWHATSPQLGQGANMALIDALSLATALRMRPDAADAIAAHFACRRLHVAFYQALSVVLTPFYQSDSRLLPVLRDHLVAPLLRRRGIIHSMIAAMVCGGVLDPIGRVGRMVGTDGAERMLERMPVHG